MAGRCRRRQASAARQAREALWACRGAFVLQQRRPCVRGAPVSDTWMRKVREIRPSSSGGWIVRPPSGGELDRDAYSDVAGPIGGRGRDAESLAVGGNACG